MAKFSGLGGRLYRGETSVDFIGKRKIWYSISGLLILASAVTLFTQGLHFMLKAAVVGVVLQQISQVVRWHQIIHANNFKTAALNRRAIHQATNATETVDTNSNCHG